MTTVHNHKGLDICHSHESLTCIFSVLGLVMTDMAMTLARPCVMNGMCSTRTAKGGHDCASTGIRG